MKKIHFEQIKFQLSENKLESNVRCIFMNYFYFNIMIESKFNIKKGDIWVDEKDEKKILNDIYRGLGRLRFLIDNKITHYINREIPLIGSNFIGIVDRDTNILEVKPITGCNINCIFCSVDEGTLSKKNSHFLIESDYLVRETIKIANMKKNKINIYINPHGEPLLYSDIERLIKKLRESKKIDTITVITNGVLLSKSKIENMRQSGLNQINISLNAFNREKGEIISGVKYPIEKVKEMIIYASKFMRVIVSPVLVYGYNEKEIELILEWVSKLKNKNIILGIQNFLPYKRGRNPIKGIGFDKFNQLLDKWEKEYKLKLHNPDVGIRIVEDKILKKPYKVNSLVEVKVLYNGRYDGEYFCVGDERIVIVKRKNLRIGKIVKTKIVKNKDNIYYGI